MAHAIARVSVTLGIGNSCLENQDLLLLLRVITSASMSCIFVSSFVLKLFNILEEIHFLY